MTDSPRFKPFIGNPDEAHLDYHGGRFVDFVLRRADRRLAAAGRPVPTLPPQPLLGAMLRILRLGAILASFILARIAALRANARRSPLLTARNPERSVAGEIGGRSAP
jgi:hypothetical protein